ncbi:uncharacterized protein Gasu_66170 [Galdieria sulphuraria]|uniref:Uncharacterized protein n=1 Tax=Galdieria sulphuraria TaxID=130081 RepID=M2XQ23_GALSU|nr:uncharacterized protein Gasu_66170 [Galdieria sulphuraria]EME25723.1 hypothetical protein Gasu_66170 [Galdieria sulphuraria]|eukprot:XP_005702243.1 hypothetical protein Gasu_66170 [Galdieria sulphuraria]
MAIFKSKLRGPIYNRPLFSNCPPFPLAEKSVKSVYIGAQHIMQNQTQWKQRNLHFRVYQYDSTLGQFWKQQTQTSFGQRSVWYQKLFTTIRERMWGFSLVMILVKQTIN